MISIHASIQAAFHQPCKKLYITKGFLIYTTLKDNTKNLQVLSANMTNANRPQVDADGK